MKNYINTIKNICAYLGLFLVMIGGCLADSESLIPTIIFVALGGLFVFIYTKIEKAQEENKSKLN